MSAKLDTWYFAISAILNYEISVETNVGNHDAIFDSVGRHGYRRSGHMQYSFHAPLIDQAVLVSGLFV